MVSLEPAAFQVSSTMSAAFFSPRVCGLLQYRHFSNDMSTHMNIRTTPLSPKNNSVAVTGASNEEHYLERAVTFSRSRAGVESELVETNGEEPDSDDFEEVAVTGSIRVCRRRVVKAL